ncbi:MAG: type II secretion system protein [Candidatus Shapirobacteria bacterium]
MRNKGFTLVELLVVMTIIVVISSVAMVSYVGSGKKARDSRRIADLEKIRLSLEMAKQVGSTYPVSLTPLETMNYLSKLPVDPKTGLYRYAVVNNNFGYTLDATMEDLGSTNGSYSSGYNYRVTNL